MRIAFAARRACKAATRLVPVCAPTNRPQTAAGSASKTRQRIYIVEIAEKFEKFCNKTTCQLQTSPRKTMRLRLVLGRYR